MVNGLSKKNEAAKSGTYSLGGLNICIEFTSNKYPHSKLNFFSGSPTCQLPEIYIVIGSNLIAPEYHATQSEIPPLFKSRYYRLYQRENDGGYEMLRYYGEEQSCPFLTVRINSQFTDFKYIFYPKCAPKWEDKGADELIFSYLANDAFLLQHSFITYNGLIIHAGGGSVLGRGMVFTGPSGAGKSTLSTLLSKSSENILFSDERLVLRSLNGQWNVWGTPWQSTGNIARNETAPLSVFIFLTHADKTSVRELTAADGLHRLLQVVSIPWYSKEWTNKGLAICESLIQDIPLYELAFRPDQTAVQAVEQLALSL